MKLPSLKALPWFVLVGVGIVAAYYLLPRRVKATVTGLEDDVIIRYPH